MYWLAAPPYLRWVGACLLLVAAFAVELRPPATLLHPFASDTIEAGTVVTADLVEWREVPAGLLAPVDLPFTAGRRVAAGEPVLVGSAAAGPAVPAGWWAVELPLPAGVAPGDPVQVVVPGSEAAGPRVVPGLVVVPAGAGDGVGRVALPAEEAATVAIAVLEGRTVVLVEPGGGQGPSTVRSAERPPVRAGRP